MKAAIWWIIKTQAAFWSQFLLTALVVDGAALRNLVYLALSAQALLERNGDELSNRTVRDIDTAIAGIRERCEIWRG